MKHLELQKFQNSTFDEFTQKKFVEDQKTTMELSGRLQELQNEVKCMNDSRDFRDAESICSGNSHVYQSTRIIPQTSSIWRDVEAFVLFAADKMRSRQTFGIHPVYQETFLHIHKLLRQLRILMELNSSKWNTWKKTTEEPIHLSTAEKSGRPERDSDLRCQSRTVSQKFSHLQWRRLFKELWGRPTTTADFGSSYWQVPYASIFFAGRWGSRLRYVIVHNFLRKQCSGSKKWSWLIQWTIWDFRHLFVVFQCLILRYSMRGLLQPWTRSSIIHISKRKISLEEQNSQKEDRFLRGRQIGYLIYEQFRVTGTDSSVENYTDLFTIFCEMTISGIRFKVGRNFSLWRKSRLMTSWKDCTNEEYESLISSRPYWNCTIWRLIRS